MRPVRAAKRFRRFVRRGRRDRPPGGCSGAGGRRKCS